MSETLLQTAPDPLASPSDTEASAFSLVIGEDNIGVITIDVPGEKLNTLKRAFADQILAVVQQAQQHAALRGLILVSGKPDSFIVGADITMLDACTSAEQGEALARQGQDTFAALSALPFPLVAAIHGPCLGGGLELALACDYRLCSLDEKTVLGLPEVQLGLLPGSGGTQRLPRLIGVDRALDVILTGRSVKARQALAYGLVDDVVPHSILLDAAVALIKKGKKNQQALPWRTRLVNSLLVRRVLLKVVKQKTRAKTQGNYPAADRILQVIKRGMDKGSREGYQQEARAFGKLLMTPASAALRHLFFATTALKKERGTEVEARPIRRVGILGGA